MTTPAIAYTGPAVESSVPFEVRRHLQLIYQKLGNHTQAFALQQSKINAIKSGTSTTIEEGGSGGGGSIVPFTQSILAVNNQSGVTSYATIAGDDGALIVLSDASAIAVSLTTQSPPWGTFIANQGAGTATLTPASGTISYAGNPGAVSMPLLGGYCTIVAFDGTNWWAWTEPIVPVTFGAVTNEFLTAYNAATGVFSAAQPAFTNISGIAAVAQGGTGTATPGLVAGTNVSITGTWPNQTINASTAGLSVTVTTAKLTSGGTQGSMTFTNGLLTSQVQAT